MIPRRTSRPYSTSHWLAALYHRPSKTLTSAQSSESHNLKGQTNNYRPISNLSVISKLLERAVCSQLAEYIDDNNLMPPNQSAYRRSHSTETALTVVFSDIIRELDRGNLVLLSMLDLSAAFDCVDHDILLNRLVTSYDIRSTSRQWLTSYLSSGTQSVRYNGSASPAEIKNSACRRALCSDLYYSFSTLQTYI